MFFTASAISAGSNSKPILAEIGVNALNINCSTIADLPLTGKHDIELHNDDFLAVPSAQVVDIVLSSGTTGKPIHVMYTEPDLKRLAYNEKLSFSSCGMTNHDTVLLTCTIDRCFVAGLAYFLGSRRLGAASIRNGHGSMESHMGIIQSMRPTVIVGVPTFLRKLGLYLESNGLNPQDTAVRTLICIGEPIRDKNLDFLKLGADLQNIWPAQAFSTYASSETITTFCECTAKQGGHLHPDLAVVEIVDENGTPVPAGATGEVVITPLNVQGMPLIRFKTGDMSFLVDEPCSCGRVSPRLGPIIGRKKQMMKVKGTTLYPQAVYSALDEITGLSEYYIVVTSEDDLADMLTVYAAVHDESCSAAVIEEKLQARLRVKPTVKIAPEEQVRKQVYQQASRKPVRYVDMRS